ncbi:hypothetical protein IscW_ISCW002025 [Ixodes scapularis]|uniref:Uncharacterized protein n=1 Tax=Ixodes scapularis TaxID=6945 RepID=B7PAX9_IXOSC|nr:hypothetical protein IscW_ISCW002025 [Ixodes scapularis]|eukprot:XP_002407406.1 hypothetical protein IscW_ISCW002025 [Ixodes scapularis]
MYVYVRYLLDNETAIMPVKFVKNFSPKSIKDIPTNPVQAYWRSEAYGEAYYEATVLLMAVAFSRCPKRAPKKDKKEGGKQGQKKPARELSVKKVVKKLMGDFMVEKNRSAEKAQGMQKKAPSHCLDAEEDM